MIVKIRREMSLLGVGHEVIVVVLTLRKECKSSLKISMESFKYNSGLRITMMRESFIPETKEYFWVLGKEKTGDYRFAFYLDNPEALPTQEAINKFRILFVQPYKGKFCGDDIYDVRIPRYIERWVTDLGFVDYE